MSEYGFILEIAIILLSTKVFGLLSRRCHLPQVVGALMAGIILGPACLNVLHGSEFLSNLSELGVILIMFSAGLETNISQLKENGKAGMMVASIGVLVPLLGGLAFGAVFYKEETFFQHLFIGVILTATSVGITVETLKEMGKLSTKVGNTILAAALIDDILGLICLTLISSLASGSGGASDILPVLGKILLFFIFVGGLGFLMHKLFAWYSHKLRDEHLQRFPVIALFLCFAIAFCAEYFFGVADIIGAFAAGLIVGNTTQTIYIESRIRPLSYLLLTPIFFANIGIGIDLSGMNSELVICTVAFVLLSVAVKVFGCGIGALLSKMPVRRSLQVGIGMVCRGEVALIVAEKGKGMGLMPETFFTPVVIMVVVTAVLTPAMLKYSFRGEEDTAQLHDSRLIDHFSAAEQLDAVSRQLITMDQKMRTGGSDEKK